MRASCSRSHVAARSGSSASARLKSSVASGLQNKHEQVNQKNRQKTSRAGGTSGQGAQVVGLAVKAAPGVVDRGVTHP